MTNTVPIIPGDGRIVVETPLSGDVRKHYRYLLWCLRGVYLSGLRPIASHLICPWFMDDAVEKERNDGIGWPWMWLGDPHIFLDDIGMSRGMGFSWDRCENEGIVRWRGSLKAWNQEAYEGWSAGGWPPHTAGMGLE